MRVLFLFFIICLISFRSFSLDVIRINQMGYLPSSVKVAVFLSDGLEKYTYFQLIESTSGMQVFKGKVQAADAKMWGLSTALRLNFTEARQPGEYYLQVGK
ncbi:MAG: cellulase N-terminal Ig-like domain-containing protein, partial [Bacteroidales bacterium]